MKTRKHHLCALSGFSLLVCAAVLLCLSCGGGGGSGSSASNSSDPPAAVTPLSVSDVTTVVHNAVTSVMRPWWSRLRTVPETSLLCSKRPERQPRRLEILAQVVPADELAVSLARTAAFFSNDQAPLSSRTVRFISGIHFPPGVAGTANADLYGIENTNRGCTLSTNFLPGQALNPSRSIDGSKTGLGIITGKADVNDSDPLAVNPGGVPLFNSTGLVGGVGVVSTSPEIAEFAAFAAAFPTRVLPTLPPPGVVIIGGIALPFVNQQTQPAGTTTGTFAGSYSVGPTAGKLPPEEYLVGPNAGTALSQSDVNEIILNAVATANTTRAVIRLPPGSKAKMTIAVSDLDGTLLGLYRMH